MSELNNSHAATNIEGYYAPRAHETVAGNQEDAFDRAKAETLKWMKHYMKCVEKITAKEFFEQTGRNVKLKSK